MVQLVYASDHDVVALFIAPRTTKSTSSKYHLAAIELNGVRCHRHVPSAKRLLDDVGSSAIRLHQPAQCSGDSSQPFLHVSLAGPMRTRGLRTQRIWRSQ
jgi:hypothetical protein